MMTPNPPTPSQGLAIFHPAIFPDGVAHVVATTLRSFPDHIEHTPSTVALCGMRALSYHKATYLPFEGTCPTCDDLNPMAP